MIQLAGGARLLLEAVHAGRVGRERPGDHFDRDVAPEAGITRDAIAVDVEWHGRRFRIHDTAGLRRRSRIEEKLVKLSVADALNAVRFAEVVGRTCVSVE